MTTQDTTGYDEAPLEAAMAVVAMPATRADDDLIALADSLAERSATFISTVDAVSRGAGPDSAMALLLLETSSILAAGARLGAITDIVPEGRWEPDAGEEPAVEKLRDRLADVLADVDEYIEVFDPYGSDEVMRSRLSDDLATTVADLLHGMAHHAAGRPIEALWWWQTTYLNSWGSSVSGALRALQSLIAHVRLGAPLG